MYICFYGGGSKDDENFYYWYNSGWKNKTQCGIGKISQRGNHQLRFKATLQTCNYNDGEGDIGGGSKCTTQYDRLFGVVLEYV